MSSQFTQLETYHTDYEPISSGTISGASSILIGEIVQFPKQLSATVTSKLNLRLCNGDDFNPFSFPDLSAIIGHDFGTDSINSNPLLPNLIQSNTESNLGNKYFLRGRNDFYNDSGNNNVASQNLIANNMLPSHKHNVDYNINDTYQNPSSITLKNSNNDNLSISFSNNHLTTAIQYNQNYRNYTIANNSDNANRRTGEADRRIANSGHSHSLQSNNRLFIQYQSKSININNQYALSQFTNLSINTGNIYLGSSSTQLNHFNHSGSGNDYTMNTKYVFYYIRMK
jgi:hypothetical protein